MTEFVLSAGRKGTKSLNVGRSRERTETESGAVVVETKRMIRRNADQMRGETIQRRKKKIEEERRLRTVSTRLHIKFSDCGKTYSDNLLVDTGATSHTINDKSKSISFDEDFDPNAHIIWQ